MEKKIYCSIATLPERIKALELCVNSIINQVDYLQVILNNYDKIPSFLKSKNKISVVEADNEFTDASKFINTSEMDGYIFTLDDDLQVPSGYTSLMIEGIEKYKGIVSLHGKTMKERPVKSYLDGIMKAYHWNGELDEDTKLDIPGSGIMAWDSTQFNISPEYCKTPYMTDIWTAIRAKELNVDMWCLKHPKKYLTHIVHPWCIWKETKQEGFTKQKEIINAYL